MNPLTQVKNIQKATAREHAEGISEQGSWHERFKDSAYINVGLLPFELTEGDLLAIFAQYGEIVDVNLVRDKATGKSRGFAFLAYEDQRSTVLAVDNLNGATVVGRTIRVDHVVNYKKKIEEDEEEEQRKREERGVCYAFQRGECNRGAACKFSHDLQRNANTGWGRKDDAPTFGRQRNGGSPPPPPWKQGKGLKEGLKDNPPPWRRSSGPKDDPPPSRKENDLSSTPQTRDDNRQKNSQLPRRFDDRIRYDGPSSSSRQRTSQIDEIPVRGPDSHDSARPSRRYDDVEDGHRGPAKSKNDDSARPSRRYDDMEDGHRVPAKYKNDDSARPSRRYDDKNDLVSRRERTHRDVSPDARTSGKRPDDSAPRIDRSSEDVSSPKRMSGKRRDEREDIDDDRRASRSGNQVDVSPHHRSDRRSVADNPSRNRGYNHVKDDDKSFKREQRSPLTKRRRDNE